MQQAAAQRPIDLRILPRRPLRDEAYELLRRSIATGALAPGAKLVEVDLAARLGISRTPLREAFRRLEAEGVLARAPGGGLQVQATSSEEAEEIFGIRAVLEGFAARLAARRASGEALERLEAVLRAAGEALDRAPRERLLELNTRFHDGINAQSGSRRLQGLLSSLHDRVLLYRRLTLGLPGERRRSWEEHREILRALRARNGREAERLVVRHVTRKLATVLAYLRDATRHPVAADGGRAAGARSRGGQEAGRAR